ncbi:hypothetical protein [Cysteiniphilum sp. JM-1]|uniref:hypothetical protein n=1 Tax=Cysteiniphilum sp. JM-1 TaxID=2610891 RepID=UPI001243BDEA|nr:hypothetical protein [Cysteiniphilum sp. JM-1]
MLNDTPAGTTGFDELAHLLKELAPLSGFLYTFAAMSGIVLLIMAFVRLKHLSNPQQGYFRFSPLSTMLYFVSGTCLIALPSFVKLISGTFFGVGNYEKTYAQCLNIDSYNTPSAKAHICDFINHFSSQQSQQMMQVLLVCLAIIGIAALIKGTTMLIKIGEGQEGHLGRTFAHIIASVCALNSSFVFTVLQHLTK